MSEGPTVAVTQKKMCITRGVADFHKPCGAQSVSYLCHVWQNCGTYGRPLARGALRRTPGGGKQRTVALEKIKQKLLSELNHVDAENRAIGEFKSELEQLLMEKMAHVEELRQIHADINAIELVIKQTDENRGRAADRVRRLMEDYRPLKMEVDRLRRDCLGLESLPEIESEALSDIAPQR
ncbi:hypothetical protein QYM36_010333 [Artemia franciscana]|uniref:Uncharacterized protein n=1 Tax=Artemia franciscana TaxID=6661 RepID=A0AA88HPP9_ARTSF|nr:hypothetical protein QYM36_010333 [Artemia franciscana]